MTPHLQVETQNGKTRIKIVELPEEPGNDEDGNPPEHPQLVQYQWDYDKALSKGIEVHPESIALAYVMISRVIYKDSARLIVWPDQLPDGLYPVSVRVNDTDMVWDEEKQDWKQCAILEEIKNEHDSPILNKILSEITPEEQAKTDKEMTEKMEAPDAEKIIRDWFIGLPQPSNGGKYVFKYNELIKLLTDGSGQVLSSLRKEVEKSKLFIEDSEGEIDKGARLAYKEVLTLIDTLTPKK